MLKQPVSCEPSGRLGTANPVADPLRRTLRSKLAGEGAAFGPPFLFHAVIFAILRELRTVELSVGDLTVAWRASTLRC